MKEVKIKIIKDYDGLKCGKVLVAKLEDAKKYVEHGYAEFIKEESKGINLVEEWENAKKNKYTKEEDAEFYKWVGVIERHPEIYGEGISDISIIPEYLLERLSKKFESVKQYLDNLPIDKFEEDEEGNIKLTKESVKEKIKGILCLDEIDREEEIESLSESSGIKIGTLRKQLISLIKKNKENNIGMVIKEEKSCKYSEEQMKEAMKLFDNENLLEYIKGEISKDHLGDDNLKMTLFLVAVSGLSCDQKKRVSTAIISNSSDGKDNAMKSILKHIPEDKYLFVTSATQASIEDDIQNTPILVFSELNSNRENGANKNLVEVIKQRTEGGTSAIKKDLRDGMKSTRHEMSEQGTVIFSTTESHMDDEMRTRFLNLNIKSTREKIHAVNNNTLDSFSDIDKILMEFDDKDSDIRVGLTGFCRVFDGFLIALPYVKYLKDFSFIDDADPRSKRDLKRILSLTCAMTFLNSRRRKRYQKKGVNFIESVPQDLIDTLKISKEFFNQSYTGMDSRTSSVLNFIDKHKDEWVERGEIQEHLQIKSLNTLKEYLSDLAMGGRGLIEGKTGKDLNWTPSEIGSLSKYHNSKIYYKTCQKGVKKVFLTCQLSELKDYLDNKIEEDKKNLHVEGEKPLIKKEIPIEIDTFSLTPFFDEAVTKEIIEAKLP